MNEVYIAGRGLASALGPDLAAALIALQAGDYAPQRFVVHDGFSWPYHALREVVAHTPDADWTARARRITQRIAADSGALHGERSGPLFLASSSLDIGAREDGSGIHVDYPHFAETVAGWLDWRGPVFTVSTACTSGLNALLSARALLRHGRAAHALVLGLELSNRVTVAGFGAMQLLSATRALPFGAERDGVVLGEAVAALYLSTAPSRWRLAGGANVVDGSDPAGIVPSAVAAMCQRALADSGVSARDIALIKPQAAGSPTNDATEARALSEAFTPLPALLTLKAAIGHTLGAAGVAELALLIGCLETGIWPRYDYPQDPRLNATLREAPLAHVRHVLACILGFGGGHTAVVLEDRAA